MLELEVGQLFRDIAVAISVSVILSLLVAVTLIPALANWLLSSRRASRRRRSPAAGQAAKTGEPGPEPPPFRLPLPGIDHLARLFCWAVLGFTRLVVNYRLLALLVAATVCGGAAFTTWKLLPKLEYLPTGNRNLVIALSLPPPGYNLDTVTGIAHKFEADLQPYLAAGDGVVRGKAPKLPGAFEQLMARLGLIEDTWSTDGTAANLALFLRRA